MSNNELLKMCIDYDYFWYNDQTQYKYKYSLLFNYYFLASLLLIFFEWLETMEV